MSVNFRYNYDSILFLGASGSGKTTLARKLIGLAPAARTFIVDSNFEYPNNSNRIRPNDYSSKWLDSFIRDFRSKHFNCLLVIEDLDLDNPMASKELSKWAANGRHQNIGLLLMARRPMLLPKVLLMKMQFFAIFVGLLPDDKDYLVKINSKLEKIAFPTEMFKYIIVDNY